MTRGVKYTNPPRIKVRERTGSGSWSITYYNITTLSPKTKKEAEAIAQRLRAQGYRARVRKYKAGYYVFSTSSHGVS